MQFFRIFSTLLMISTGSISSLNAQSKTASDGPAETPSASFTGKQYVDSQGCVFIRAGFDDNVIWVPRVTSSREQLCGFAPTTSGVAQTNAPEVVEETTEIVSMETVVSDPEPTTTTKVSAPRAVSVAPAPLPSTFRVPRGFRVAWTDGRLNAKRGPRTAQGDAQMEMVWKNTLPRKLVQTAAAVTVGTAGAQYVQVGAYALTSNVDTVVAWLQRKRLPVGLSGSRRDGRDVQLVLAGPFTSQDKLDEVLAMTHRAGFSDAFIR